MPLLIDELIATASDFDLCNEVFKRIDSHHPRDTRLKEFSRPERVVLCVWNCHGIIGNGGFRYLLEATYVGDPRLKYAYQAFDILGCKPAFDAFRRTFSVFPDGFPPADIDKRMKIYLKAMRKWPTEEDLLMFKAPVEKALADFIRARPEAFAHLNGVSSQMAAVEVEEPEEIEKRENPYDLLPHWARVAFAIRIAWDIFPLLREYWPQIPTKYMAYVRKALEIGEEATIGDVDLEQLRIGHRECLQTAGAALMMLEGKRGAPVDGISATKASQVAKTAEFALLAARQPSDESAEAVQETVFWAFTALEEKKHKKFNKQMSANYYALKRLAATHKWTDRTKMPANLWDRLN